MSSDPSSLGCQSFISVTGRCGVMLGTEGEHAGIVYDFFASPKEEIGAVYGLMNLVLEKGANKLTICANNLLASFFEQFGFEAVAMLAGRNAPSNWIPDACRSALDPMEWPDFAFMARKVYETSPFVTEWQARVQKLPRPSEPLDGRHGPCANCAAAVANEDYFGLFGGYQCRRCGFIYVYGTLTVGIPQLQ
jgi:hypothetical protein